MKMLCNAQNATRARALGREPGEVERALDSEVGTRGEVLVLPLGSCVSLVSDRLLSTATK